MNKIYSFLDISLESYSDANVQVNKEIHQKSMKKEEFLNKKQEFTDAFLMQRQFWIKKGIIDENSSVFKSLNNLN